MLLILSPAQNYIAPVYAPPPEPYVPDTVNLRRSVTLGGRYRVSRATR